MAPSSSAKKVAKLASRGKGKRVRFSGGTTYPVVVASVSVAVVALIAYAKWSVPAAETGPPTVDDQWTMAYDIRVCNTTITLEGSPNDLTTQDASAGDANQLAAGANNSAGFINYHPQDGSSNTGRNARLGVFLDAYDVELNDDRLVIPASQTDGQEAVYDTDDDSIFDGTECEGDDPVIKVRVWRDASTNSFEDKVTAFDDIRFVENGMAFVIAVVPEGDNDFEIPKPDTAARLSEFGVIGEGDAPSDTTPETTPDSTPDSTPADTTPADTSPDDTATSATG